MDRPDRSTLIFRALPWNVLPQRKKPWEYWVSCSMGTGTPPTAETLTYLPMKMKAGFSLNLPVVRGSGLLNAWAQMTFEFPIRAIFKTSQQTPSTVNMRIIVARPTLENLLSLKVGMTQKKTKRLT